MVSSSSANSSMGFARMELEFSTTSPAKDSILITL